MDLGGEILLAEVTNHLDQLVRTDMVFEIRRIPDLLEEFSQLGGKQHTVLLLSSQLLGRFIQQEVVTQLLDSEQTMQD